MTYAQVLEDPRRKLRQMGAVLVAGSMILWAGIAQGAPAPESFSGLAKQVSPAVVYIATTMQAEEQMTGGPDLPFDFPEGSPFEKFFKQFRDQMEQGNRPPRPHLARALGSGFIIDASGYVVTNNHVVKDADEVKVRLTDDSEYTAEVIGTDPMTDLALLKIKAEHPLPYVKWGDSDRSEVGDWVMAVGNPFGLGGTVTAGIISARGRNINSGPYDDFLQIDAPINKGNSGGPLFNLDGKVIGVNTAIYSPNGGSVGIGFSVPSNMAKPVIAQLKEHGSVNRGWLGVRIQEVTPEMAEALGLDDASGTIVTDVNEDSPAQKSGLKQGDVILSLDGKAVDGPRDLARMVGEKPAGSDIALKIMRGKSKRTIDVVTGVQPESMRMAQADTPHSTPGGTFHSKTLAADLAPLTPTRRNQLGIDEGINGVVVVDVESLDPGLRPGDVIKQVDQHNVSAPRQVEDLVSKAKTHDAKSVLFLVSRGGQDLYLGVKLKDA